MRIEKEKWQGQKYWFAFIGPVTICFGWITSHWFPSLYIDYFSSENNYSINIDPNTTPWFNLRPWRPLREWLIWYRLKFFVELFFVPKYWKRGINWEWHFVWLILSFTFKKCQAVS